PERDQLEGETVRGWWRRSLGPVWDRYLPALEDDDEGGAEEPKNGESPVFRSQSVGVSGSADFPRNQANSSSATLDPEVDHQERTVGTETRTNKRNPDPPTLSGARTAETPNQAPAGHVYEQLAVTAEAAEHTLDIGAGGSLQAHR